MVLKGKGCELFCRARKADIVLFLYSHYLTFEESPSRTFGPVVCVDYDVKSTIGYKSSALFPDYITGAGPFPFSSREGAPNMWICPQDVERKYGGRGSSHSANILAGSWEGYPSLKS